MNDLCRERRIYHISDEAYEYFTYDGAEHFSPGSLESSAPHTISLYSFSKAYGFASWRIGCMVVPSDLMLSIRKIQDTALICATGVAQWAAVGALEAGVEYCRSKLASLTVVRDAVLAGLQGIGDRVTISPASGAFYQFLRVNSPLDSMQLVRRLIEEHQVAVVPGSTFGQAGCYLRVSYGALGLESAAEAVDRLAAGLKSIL